jgi:methyl-accepting chemotaxis protein
VRSRGISDQKDRELLAEDRASIVAFTTAHEQLLNSSRARNGAHADNAMVGDFVSLASKVDRALQAHRAYNVKLADDAVAEAQSTMSSARLMLALIAGATLVIVAMLGTWLTRSLLRQLGTEPVRLVEVATRIASGDLTAQIKVSVNDQASVLSAVKTMRDGLADIVQRLKAASDAVATGASQIAAGNTDLSSRTEEQASSLEETAASMEEMASTVKQNADNARQANQLAASASEVAERGGSVVSKVVGTMQAISASSTKISEIVSVIDGIAFQTNILALNAAVEAARAGEQGKGFAVVAGEVRTLAQRSANAAKEIKELIENSADKVNVGAEQVECAGATMQEIVTAVKRVTHIIGEITSASNEQARGVDQINVAITQIDQVNQQNAALVEEAAAAASALQDQAAELVRSVATFKISGTHVLETMADRQAQVVKTSLSQPANFVKKPAKLIKTAPRLENKSTSQGAIEVARTATSSDDWTSF